MPPAELLGVAHPRRSDVGSASLRQWAVKSTFELLDAYRSAEATTSIAVLDGDPECLGLALDGVLSGRDGWIRARAPLAGFAWNGKSFRIDNPRSGWGFNRLGAGSVLASLPFDVTLGPSHVDGRDAVRIDYSQHPRCPWWHRRVLDELREVEPGVFIGPAGVRRRRGNQVRILAWFGVDTTRGVRGAAI